MSWPGFGYFSLAEARGLFDPRMLRAELQIYPDGLSQNKAYIRGQANAIATTLADVLAICGEAPDRCPTMIYVLDDSLGADQLLASPGHASVSDLRDKSIALEGSALQLYLVNRAFEVNGLPVPRREQLKMLPPDRWMEALRSGTVQAAMSYPPLSEKLRDALSLQPVFTTREIPGEVIDVLAVDPELVVHHSRALTALVRGWRDARRDERNQSLSVRQEIARGLGLSLEQLYAIQHTIRYPGLQEQYQLLNPNHNNLSPLIRKVHTTLYRAGSIPAHTPLPTSTDQVVVSLLEEPLPRRQER